jgi:hypothetical protein
MPLKSVIKACLGGLSKTDILEWRLRAFQDIGLFVMPMHYFVPIASTKQLKSAKAEWIKPFEREYTDKEAIEIGFGPDTTTSRLRRFTESAVIGRTFKCLDEGAYASPRDPVGGQLWPRQSLKPQIRKPATSCEYSQATKRCFRNCP